MKQVGNGSTASAIRETLVSPNECDRNLEAANVVDGLFAIARALDHVAVTIAESFQSKQPQSDALETIASAIGEVATVIENHK